MKNIFITVFKRLKKNFWMKIAAVGLAALLWLFVIADTNPSRVKVFRNIPVTFTNTQVLNEKGLCLSDDYSSIISNANVEVEANTETLQYLDEDEISVTIDVSSVNSAGNYTLKLKGNTPKGNVVRVFPSEVDVTVEDLLTRELPVEVQVIGDMDNAYYYGDITLSDDVVEISGPRSIVETYAKAVCYVDIKGVTGPITESKNIIILDTDGNEIEQSGYTEKLPSVIVDYPIYPQRSVNVDMRSVYQGISGIAEGYEIKEVIIQPTQVLIAGYEENISSVPYVTLEPIVLSDAKEDVNLKAGVIVPDGVEAIVPEAVEISIKIGVIEEEKVYESVDLSVKNLAKGFKYTIKPESMDIRVVGTVENLEKIKANDIIPFVDLDGLGAGNHTVEIKFENEPDIPARLLPEYYTAEVVIEKK